MSDNPKYVQAMKDGKARMENIPLTVLDGDAAVHSLGADKYGRFNWRQDPILATTYVAAMLRHLTAWAGGEDLDPESGKSHLYHIRACCAVALDADIHGKLIDDRNKVESKK